MMELNKIPNFKNSLENLEDLRSLLQGHDELFIDQIKFNLSKAMSEYEKMHRPGQFPHLMKIIQEGLSESLIHLLTSTLQLENITLKLEKNELSTSQWNQILKIFPDIKDLLKELHISAGITIVIEPENIDILFSSFDFNIFSTNEKNIRFCLQNLLAKETFTTWSSKYSAEKIPTIRFSLGHREESLFMITVDGGSHPLRIGMSNVVFDFQKKIAKENLHFLKNSISFHLNDQLQFSYIEGPQLDKIMENEETWALVFPFLFDSISIIIPKKGMILSTPPKLDDQDEQLFYLDLYSYLKN